MKEVADRGASAQVRLHACSGAVQVLLCLRLPKNQTSLCQAVVEIVGLGGKHH